MQSKFYFYREVLTPKNRTTTTFPLYIKGHLYNRQNTKITFLPLHVPPLRPAQGYNAFLGEGIQGEWVNTLHDNTEKTSIQELIHCVLLSVSVTESLF